MLNTTEILLRYQQKALATKLELDQFKTKIDRFSLIRVGLLLFEIAAFIFLVSSTDDLELAIGLVFLILPILVFIVIVKRQAKIVKKAQHVKQLLWIYENEISVLTGSTNGYGDGVEFVDDQHEYTSDLDIFGTSSLFALLNRCSTNAGNLLLASKLNQANSEDEIRARQKAIIEIQSVIEQTVDFRAYLKGHDASRIDQLKNKLKTQLAHQLYFTKNVLLRYYIKFLPYLMPVLLLIAVVFGGKFWGIISLIALAHATITFSFMQKINAIYYGFSGTANVLESYADAIKWTEEKEWNASYIRQFFAGTAKVSAQIKHLAKIIQAFDARLNILVAAVLNFGLLWDLRCCIKLDRWVQDSLQGVENGLDRIGHFEELISFSTLANNQPNWVFPAISNSFSLKTESMGHPLIHEAKRVDNNFELRKTPTVDIITGSNMAGKSTFLRTLGINTVLAYAGAPVCATQMELSVFSVVTYMRIRDSLNESTSTFKAELNRLKMILAHVATHPDALVFIDEMLRGTNSRDKYLGSKVFIEKLIQMRTSTLFATHDLQLSELEKEHQPEVRNFHFDIQISNGEMKFDYLMKAGPCSTFNADLLLKEIGLTIT